MKTQTRPRDPTGCWSPTLGITGQHTERERGAVCFPATRAEIQTPTRCCRSPNPVGVLTREPVLSAAAQSLLPNLTCDQPGRAISPALLPVLVSPGLSWPQHPSSGRTRVAIYGCPRPLLSSSQISSMLLSGEGLHLSCAAMKRMSLKVSAGSPSVDI